LSQGNVREVETPSPWASIIFGNEIPKPEVIFARTLNGFADTPFQPRDYAIVKLKKLGIRYGIGI
jgi:hypothetical protein